MLTPIRARNQDAIARVTDVEQQSIETTRRSRRGSKVIGLDRHAGFEICVEKGSKRVT